MGRQFFSTRIDELESMFDRQRQDASFLDALLEELDHRSTQRSKDLLARAVQARGVLGKHSGEINPGDRNVDFREPGLTERSIRLRILSQRVDDGTLPARAANYARLKKIIYLGDLANSSPGEMLRTPNMGVGTVQAFRRRLQSKGLDWGCDTIGWSRAYAKQLEREASEAAERAKALSPKQRRALSERADDGKLPVRAEQYLRRRRITYIGELAQLSSDEIMQTLNMGRQSVAALHQRLRAYGLDWNCDVGSWSRELARKLELQATEEAHHGEPTELGAALRQAVQEVATSERNVGIILWQRGWDGRGGATLEEVGKFHGMTRERVRQIVAKIERRLTNKAAPLALRRAVKIVKRTTPGNVEDVLSTLVREGVLAGSFDIRGLLNAADTWRLPLSLGFAGSHRTILAAPESITAIERIAQAARKACGARAVRIWLIFVRRLQKRLVANRRTPLLRARFGLMIWSGWIRAKAGSGVPLSPIRTVIAL
jgi:hypothetical protein